MAKERLKTPRLRLFVALDLPADVRERVVAWRERELGEEERVRMLDPAALHFTLAFLGYQRERDTGRLAEAATAGLATAAPELRFEPEPVGVPRGRPRLYALDARGEGATALAEELFGRLEATRLWRREKRPFWPHVTIARMRPERKGSKKPARLSSPPGPLPKGLRHPFVADRVVLYRSILHPQGAEYVALAEAQLERGR